jgi:hypothetical protein
MVASLRAIGHPEGTFEVALGWLLEQPNIADAANTNANAERALQPRCIAFDSTGLLDSGFV